MGEATYEFTEEEQECDSRKEENALDYVRMGIGEFGCVFIIVFISCMGCIVGLSEETASHLQKCIAGGLSVMTAMQIFGHISGAHANPAVTVSAYFMNIVDGRKAVIYIACQVLGGITGYAVLLFATPKDLTLSGTHCITSPNPKITVMQAFLVEIVITFILVVAINCCWDYRCKKNLDSFAMRIGFVVTACALAAGPYTGASMNPARSIGPAVWQKNYDYLHIYILAPLIGGAISGLFYQHILLKPKN